MQGLDAFQDQRTVLAIVCVHLAILARVGLARRDRAGEGRSESKVSGNQGAGQAAAEVGASQTAAFDVTDPDALDGFFADLPGPIDHLLLTGPGPTTRRWPNWTSPRRCGAWTRTC